MHFGFESSETRDGVSSDRQGVLRGVKIFTASRRKEMQNSLFLASLTCDVATGVLTYFRATGMSGKLLPHPSLDPTTF